MIRHTHQIGGVTTTIHGFSNDQHDITVICDFGQIYTIPAPRSPTPADGNGSEAHAAEATNGCGITGHIGRECVGMPTGEVVQAASPDWFASIPSFGRDWPAGVLSFHAVEPKP